MILATGIIISILGILTSIYARDPDIQDLASGVCAIGGLLLGIGIANL